MRIYLTAFCTLLLGLVIGYAFPRPAPALLHPAYLREFESRAFLYGRVESAAQMGLPVCDYIEEMKATNPSELLALDPEYTLSTRKQCGEHIF